MNQSGRSGTIRESNHALGVRKARNAKYYVRKNFISFARAGVSKKKNSTESSGSSHSKIHYSDYPKRFINNINEVHDFSIKYRYRVIKVDPRCTSEV